MSQLVLRIALVATILVLAGCATPQPVCTSQPTGARASFLYYANTTENELRSLLEREDWSNVAKNPDAPGIGLSATRSYANQTVKAALNAFGFGGPTADQPVVGIGLRADDANVTSDDAARQLLGPLADEFKTLAPTSWGEPTAETYSGGDETCVG